MNLRARYENAHQDGKQTAEASTLQTLFGWRTRPIWNTSLTLEGINVGRLDDDYNDGQNGKSQFPVIANPDDTYINQLYVDWAGLPATLIRGGRQVVKLDNVRFVGNVAFRQVMQVFNGVTVENKSLLYTLEYAKQTDYAHGDARIDAHYLRLGIGGRWGGYFLRADREQLSSNDGEYGFQTPLATRHPFQGWADQFLTTPSQGLRDTYLTGGAKIEKAQLIAEYHRFKSDFGGIDFGNETDLGVSYPLLQKLTGRFEYARSMIMQSNASSRVTAT